MSNYIHDVDLTLTEKQVWRPAKKGEHCYKYIVQKAPSARARCRKCSHCVEKGALRCGVPIKHPGGDHGWISAWQHVGCTRIEERGRYTDFIFGLSDLSAAEQDEVIREITSNVLPEHLKPLDPDDLVRRGKLEEMQEPRTLLRPLLPYQKEGLGWMVRQEENCDIKGGILADEMGMGKTIQMVSLLLARRVPGPTLVVCPVSSMLQWESEIKEHVTPGTLSVLVVYRTTKITKDDMENADVVLTTYPMIEQAWRSLIHRIKVPCPYCGDLFIPRQLVVHNRYFCGPNAKKTLKQAKRERHKQHSSKVQSKETIRKGLRTLHVDVDEDDDAEVDDDTRKNTSTKRKQGGVESTVAVKKGAAMKVSEEANDSDKKQSFDPAPRGVVGPIGMYQELMREAGRTVRSRWDRSRREDESSTTSSSDDKGSSSTTSAADEDEEEYDESEKAADAAMREEQEQARLAAFCCQVCGFQILRYPFCPRTGQHHVLTDEMKQVIENDTGGDEVDLNSSIFHSIRWARIVLDEAHRIKGRTTSTARSAFALNAEYRWCLTGTPLQNRVGDIYSLLRFLRIRPYARYYCLTEGCSCSTLSHPFSGTSLRQCVFCGHGPLQHYAHFNRYVLNPITRYGYIGEGRLGMMMLSNDVFSKAMLRRTKEERAADLHLPPLHMEVRRIQLTPEERDFYESLYKRSTSEFDTFVKKGTMLHNYAHIFQLLSRLRQALDHPLMVVKGMNMGPVVNAKGVCGICGEGIEGESAIKTNPCRHAFHRLCLSQFLESAPDQAYHCPTCFVKINVDLRQLRVEWEEEGDAGAAALPPELAEELDEDAENPAEEDEVEGGAGSIRAEREGGNEERERDGEPTSRAKKKGERRSRKPSTAPSKKAEQGILSRIDPTKPLHGTKLSAIADYIQNIPSSEKVIVFSQFGDMLDLTHYWLQRRFIKAVKLCGALTLTQRQSVLQAFLHDPSVRVILISLKAGGEGLNLQVANHVVLVDPWWNPAVEMQAVQRAHRIGQTRRVQAVRFVTESSVEERMVELQDKKMLVFEGTIDGKMQSLQKLSEEDLQFLFTR